MVYKYFFPGFSLPFQFIVSFAMQKFFEFNLVPFVYFSSVASDILYRLMSTVFFPMLSSSSFMTSGFLPQSLIHVELIFYSGVKR